jgi:plasmid maintenance system killer protein
MKKDEFINLVKTVILEVKKEKADKKDKDDSYLNGEKSKFRKDIDNDPSKTVQSLIKKIESAVKSIDKKIEVCQDYHNDISVKLKGVFSIRINPKWSGIYDVEAYRNMSDRVFAVGLSEEQVLNFIKVNFAINKKSYVQTAYDKSIDNLKDNSEKKVKDLPKVEPVKNMEVPKKDIENAVTDKKDEPNAPMATVKEKDVERQEDHVVEKNKEMPKMQKMIKKEVDNDLTTKFGDTSKMSKKVG